jgi:hypothetical protein
VARELRFEINGYDADAEKELEELGKNGSVVGVCHDVDVDLGRVMVKHHDILRVHVPKKSKEDLRVSSSFSLHL